MYIWGVKALRQILHGNEINLQASNPRRLQKFVYTRALNQRLFANPPAPTASLSALHTLHIASPPTVSIAKIGKCHILLNHWSCHPAAQATGIVYFNQSQ